MGKGANYMNSSQKDLHNIDMFFQIYMAEKFIEQNFYKLFLLCQECSLYVAFR